MDTQTKKYIGIGQTELGIWFERDRQQVELRDKRTEETIVEWWDGEVSEAIEDGFLDPADYHSSAYEYAKEHDMLPMVEPHFIAMSGLHGCMPDFCCACDSLQGAVESLAQLFELGRTRKASLKRHMSLELNNSRDGAEYCEITECDCDDPESHNDN